MGNRTYQVALNYLEHDGGTKFYETVTITEQTAEGVAGAAILLQRWGKIEANTGGGQVKIIRGSDGKVQGECSKILKEKTTPRAGKGVYKKASAPTFGLGRKVISGHVRSLHEAELATAINEHYGTAERQATIGYFGLGLGDADENDVIVEDGFDDIDRGAGWASW
jgi:hypothetical protein